MTFQGNWKPKFTETTRTAYYSYRTPGVCSSITANNDLAEFGALPSVIQNISAVHMQKFKGNTVEEMTGAAAGAAVDRMMEEIPQMRHCTGNNVRKDAHACVCMHKCHN